MKANELRIGNLVRVIKAGGYNNIGDIVKVDSIDSYGINKWRDMGASGCNSFDGIEGIPLTEEWLVKMGFKYVNTLHDSTKVFEGEPFLYYKDGYARISIHTPDILYVHQLQNLYFALTGEELQTI